MTYMLRADINGQIHDDPGDCFITPWLSQGSVIRDVGFGVRNHSCDRQVPDPDLLTWKIE